MRRAVIGLAACLVLAGCSGSNDGSGTETSEPAATLSSPNPSPSSTSTFDASAASDEACSLLYETEPSPMLASVEQVQSFVDDPTGQSTDPVAMRRTIADLQAAADIAPVEMDPQIKDIVEALARIATSIESGTNQTIALDAFRSSHIDLTFGCGSS